MSRILLAEDGPTAIDLAGALFDTPGLELDVVTNGRSALGRLTRLPAAQDAAQAGAPRAYALVVLSYTLPEISGPECIAFIRSMFPRLTILVLSDTTDAKRLGELARLGIRRGHILQKPTDRKTFAAWVRNALKEIET